jgi:hypothetical protein
LSEKLEVLISEEELDKLAIAWCKQRNLQNALGGAVGLEIGSSETPWN